MIKPSPEDIQLLPPLILKYSSVSFHPNDPKIAIIEHLPNTIPLPPTEELHL